MTKFDIAIVSPTDRNTIAGVLTVWANNIQEALKRVRKDPDMEGVSIYPLNKAA